jgi:hypothetical protein
MTDSGLYVSTDKRPWTRNASVETKVTARSVDIVEDSLPNSSIIGSSDLRVVRGTL